jgi:ribosome-binding factor A
MKPRAEKKTGDGRRTQRVEKELQVIVANFLSGSYKGEIPGLLTVTQVKVPGNLRTADVFVSILNGTKEQNDQAIKVLEKRKGEIQAYIHRQLPMKHTPVLHFHMDHGMQQALRIESILKEIDQNRKTQ